MKPLSNPRYSGNWWQVFRANWQDRRAGLPAAAWARQGHLRPPYGEGKVIWVKAGDSPESVRLACELLGVIRERRLDIRLALTFEHDYADIIEPRVKGMRKIGLGYGPSDRPRAVKRVMDRLNPFGLILVDTVPHPNLLRAAASAKTHLIAFNTQPTPVMVEAAYPVDARQAQTWKTSGMCMNIAEPADPMALFAEAQIDTTLRSLVTGSLDGLHLWWWHDDITNSHSEAVTHWRKTALAQNGVLFISGKDQSLNGHTADLAISAWDRSALPPGSVVWIDDPKWYAAVSSAVTAAYLDTQIRSTFWQSLAGGSAIIPGVGTRHRFPDLPVMEPMPVQIQSICSEWLALLTDPQSSRRHGDSIRRFFWEERRRVQTIIEDFVQRIFNW